MKIIYEYKLINNEIKTDFHQVLDISQVPINDEPIYQTKGDGTTEIIGYNKTTWLSEILFQHPKIENGEIRESTIEELKVEGIIPLVDGELIREGKVLTIQRPSEIYEWKGEEWIKSDTLILAKKQEINNKYFNTIFGLYNVFFRL